MSARLPAPQHARDYERREEPDLGQHHQQELSVSHAPEWEGSPPSAFLEEFAAGADCKRLFEIRNAVKRGAAESLQNTMNEKLRSVGCYGPQNERKPLPSPVAGSFTVREYRIYRATLDVPMSVSEEEGLRRVAKRYGSTPAKVEATAEKVQMWLFNQHGFGTPDAEIRFASDWNGESNRGWPCHEPPTLKV
jgi:hypothetical protein